MRCEMCQGTGKLMFAITVFNAGTMYEKPGGWMSCPDCGGSGAVSCCEGEVGDGKIANTGEKNG